MKKTTSLGIALIMFGLVATTKAQIAINNSGNSPAASAVLDLTTTATLGFLPNTVNLVDVTSISPFTSTPATGLIVYCGVPPIGGNGAGYYYWNGSAWSSLNNTINGAGTDNYVAVWTPNATTLGTGLIQDNGTGVGINSAPQLGDMLYVGSSTGTSIVGFSTYSTTAAGVFGENDYNIGLEGYSAGAGTVGTWGESDAPTSVGVYGTSKMGQAGVYGYSDSTTGFGVIGYNASANGIGVGAAGDTGLVAYSTWNGINAYAANDNGVNSKGAFDGVVAWGGNVGVLGISSNTTGAGVVGYDTVNIGVEGLSTYSTGIGVFGENDSNIGVLGFSANATGVVGIGGFMGGIYWDGIGDTSRIAYNGYGILSNSTKSTMVKDENNQYRVLFCNESPEVMFEDYGEGQLVNGKAHITLDPVLAKNVTISEKHPLRVYIELLGDCNGTYVSNRSASGFDVNELKNGKSNTPFQWHIICNRANEAGANRNYADKRFPVGPSFAAMGANNALKSPVKQAARTAVSNKNTAVSGGTSKGTKHLSFSGKAVQVKSSQAQGKN